MMLDELKLAVGKTASRVDWSTVHPTFRTARGGPRTFWHGRKSPWKDGSTGWFTDSYPYAREYVGAKDEYRPIPENSAIVPAMFPSRRPLDLSDDMAHERLSPRQMRVLEESNLYNAYDGEEDWARSVGFGLIDTKATEVQHLMNLMQGFKRFDSVIVPGDMHGTSRHVVIPLPERMMDSPIYLPPVREDTTSRQPTAPLNFPMDRTSPSLMDAIAARAFRHGRTSDDFKEFARWKLRPLHKTAWRNIAVRGVEYDRSGGLNGDLNGEYGDFVGAPLRLQLFENLARMGARGSVRRETLLNAASPIGGWEREMLNPLLGYVKDRKNISIPKFRELVDMSLPGVGVHTGTPRYNNAISNYPFTDVYDATYSPVNWKIRGPASHHQGSFSHVRRETDSRMHPTEYRTANFQSVHGQQLYGPNSSWEAFTEGGSGMDGPAVARQARAAAGLRLLRNWKPHTTRAELDAAVRAGASKYRFGASPTVARAQFGRHDDGKVDWDEVAYDHPEFRHLNMTPGDYDPNDDRFILQVGNDGAAAADSGSILNLIDAVAPMIRTRLENGRLLYDFDDSDMDADLRINRSRWPDDLLDRLARDPKGRFGDAELALDYHLGRHSTKPSGKGLAYNLQSAMEEYYPEFFGRHQHDTGISPWYGSNSAHRVSYGHPMGDPDGEVVRFQIPDNMTGGDAWVYVPERDVDSLLSRNDYRAEMGIGEPGNEPRLSSGLTNLYDHELPRVLRDITGRAPTYESDNDGLYWNTVDLNPYKQLRDAQGWMAGNVGNRPLTKTAWRYDRTSESSFAGAPYRMRLSDILRSQGVRSPSVSRATIMNSLPFGTDSVVERRVIEGLLSANDHTRFNLDRLRGAVDLAMPSVRMTPQDGVQFRNFVGNLPNARVGMELGGRSGIYDAEYYPVNFAIADFNSPHHEGVFGHARREWDPRADGGVAQTANFQSVSAQHGEEAVPITENRPSPKLRAGTLAGAAALHHNWIPNMLRAELDAATKAGMSRYQMATPETLGVAQGQTGGAGTLRDYVDNHPEYDYLFAAPGTVPDYMSPGMPNTGDSDLQVSDWMILRNKPDTLSAARAERVFTMEDLFQRHANYFLNDKGELDFNLDRGIVNPKSGKFYTGNEISSDHWGTWQFNAHGPGRRGFPDDLLEHLMQSNPKEFPGLVEAKRRLATNAKFLSGDERPAHNRRLKLGRETGQGIVAAMDAHDPFNETPFIERIMRTFGDDRGLTEGRYTRFDMPSNREPPEGPYFVAQDDWFSDFPTRNRMKAWIRDNKPGGLFTGDDNRLRALYGDLIPRELRRMGASVSLVTHLGHTWNSVDLNRYKKVRDNQQWLALPGDIR